MCLEKNSSFELTSFHKPTKRVSPQIHLSDQRRGYILIAILEG